MTGRATLAALLAALAASLGGDARGASSGAVGAFVRANPLAVSLSLSDARVPAGSELTAFAAISNLGAESRSNVELTLRLDPTGLAVEGGELRTMPVLPGNTTGTVSWTLCGVSPGAYLVMVRAESDEFAADSPAELLEVGTEVVGACEEDASATLGPGETLTTDVEGDGASAADPVETSVTTPAGGVVAIVESGGSTAAPAGLVVLGVTVQITAPPASAVEPLMIGFELDSSLLPADADPLSLAVLRDGLALPGCPAETCVQSRTLQADGDLELVVLASAASTWTFGTIYPFAGFFPPVENPPVFNVMKAGRAVPVKFSLGGFVGFNILATGYPRAFAITCDSGASLLEQVEETLSAGESGLVFDELHQQYVYVWKTASAWDGTCRELIVRLVDGTEHRARFWLR